MPNYRMMLTMLARGGTSQADVAAVCGCSKRDVSRAAAVLRETGLRWDDVADLDDAGIAALFPRTVRSKDAGHLQPDMAMLVRRKAKSPKIPVKRFWYEHCEQAASAGLAPYSYQAFCELFSEEADRSGVSAHLRHLPGEKYYIDWAGMAGRITDRLTGRTSAAHVLVICPPCSAKVFAEAFPDMSERSWLDGRMDAFEFFGGVTRMLVPDNCATATDRTAIYVTLVNRTYRDFAEHYGCAVVPARVRRPRDKSLAESTVDLVERWAIGPSSELTFYSLEEFNEYLRERVDWLNARPFSDREGSRDSEFEETEAPELLPLPGGRYELCEWRRAKVAPNYHVRVDYMHYSVPHELIGRTCDVRLGDRRVTVLVDGEVVAEHDRLRGRKGQYSTIVDHMPDSHRDASDPWSPERFSSWAGRIGPATAEAVARIMRSHPVVEQAFVPCRNVLGLSKRYTPELLERACQRAVAGPAIPSHTGLRHIIQSIKAEDAARHGTALAAMTRTEEAFVDRAKATGRVNGADAYRRKDVTR